MEVSREERRKVHKKMKDLHFFQKPRFLSGRKMTFLFFLSFFLSFFQQLMYESIGRNIVLLAVVPLEQKKMKLYA